jgi:hypothetical protein
MSLRTPCLAAHAAPAIAAVVSCLSTAGCSANDGAAGQGAASVDGGGNGGTSSAGGGGAQTDAGGDAQCTPYTSTANLDAPAVSFAKDVLPTFQRSCGIAGATCHGSTSVVKVDQRPYLGQFDGGTDAAAVVSGLVGVPSPEDPSLSIVKPGDPGQSYLMHKLDGDQCQFAEGCAQGQTPYTDCGQQMPYSSSALDPGTRDTIRRWIAQGAKND